MPLSPFLYLIVLRNILKTFYHTELSEYSFFKTSQKIHNKLSTFILHYPIDKNILR